MLLVPKEEMHSYCTITIVKLMFYSCTLMDLVSLHTHTSPNTLIIAALASNLFVVVLF